jgi:hypothetical protein
MRKKIIFLALFCLIIILSYKTYQRLTHFSLNVESIIIDSINQIKIYKIREKIVVAEYCTFEQVIKVGVLDTVAISQYLLYNPYVGNDLFIYNCASCHSAPPNFEESIKGRVPKNKAQLMTSLCSPKHTLIDSISCKSLNDFELFLLSKYLNKNQE